MNRIHKRRLYYMAFFSLSLFFSASLILYALKQNINVFITPSEIANAHFSSDDHFRLGGMVKKGSFKREKEGLSMEFVVTDLKQEITVHYTGILPDLFREGKGVIALGYLNSKNTFIASEILAKHDENYMPKKVYETLSRKIKYD